MSGAMKATAPRLDYACPIGRASGASIRQAPRRNHVRRFRRFGRAPARVAIHPIVLQKSKVAGLRIFREITKRETIADSYNLNRVTEVACEFNVRR